jgi:acyl-coenzyme A thioesterase PaaI-like protein
MADDTHELHLTPAPGWIPVDPFPAGPAKQSFVSGTAARDRTRVTYYRTADSDHLHASVWFGQAAEGPPDSVHGGAIAAVLDEAMGAVCWMNQHPVVGARITINYRHMVPLGFSGRVESWIDHIERRKCFITSKLTDADGKVYAEGEALFVKLTPEQIEASLRARTRRKAAHAAESRTHGDA